MKYEEPEPAEEEGDWVLVDGEQGDNGELTESGNISNREDEGFDRAPQQVVGCDQRHGTPPPLAPKTHPTAATARRPDGGEGAGKAGKGARRPQEAERSPRRPASAHARGEPGWLL